MNLDVSNIFYFSNIANGVSNSANKRGAFEDVLTTLFLYFHFSIKRFAEKCLKY